MPSIARVTGLVGREPRSHTLKDGSSVVNLNVTVVDQVEKASGDGSFEQTTYINLVVWNADPETLAIALGDKIDATGRLALNRWQDKDGNSRRDIELVVGQIRVTEKAAERTGELTFA